MICKKCGAQLDNNATVCPQCGVPTENYSRAGDAGLLVVGFVCAFIFPVLGLILGVVARKRADSTSRYAPALLIVLSVVNLVIDLVFCAIFAPVLLEKLSAILPSA